MGDRHPTNEHGIYSASLYCVYGCWLRGLVVRAVTARRLLVGGKREASASSAVGSDHSGPYPYVFAGSLCSIMGLRPLSNFFSSLAPDLDSGGHRLARNTRLDRRGSRGGSLGSDGNSCFRLDPNYAQFLAKKQWPYARVAKFLHRQMQKSDVIVAGQSIGFSLSQFFEL